MIRRCSEAVLSILMTASAAFAQSPRTAVSINGNDANPCSVASPCRSFSAALAVTLPGGEVVALDSGGYGPFIVTFPVTVLAAPGVYAGVSAGVQVKTAAGDKVILRNLQLKGSGGSVGIEIPTGYGASLFVEDSSVDGFSFCGILTNNTLATVLNVSRTTVRNNGNYGGIRFSPQSGGVAQGVIADSFVHNNNAGIAAFQNSNVTVTNTVVSGNSGAGFFVNGLSPRLTIIASVSSGNLVGLGVVSSGTAFIGHSTLSGNGTGLSNSSGSLNSLGDNLVRANTTDISGVVTTIAAN